MPYLIAIIYKRGRVVRAWSEKENDARAICAIMYKHDANCICIELRKDNTLIDSWEG